MSNLIKIVKQVIAQYKPSPIYAYRGNPFIEAVRRESTSDLYNSLRKKIDLSHKILRIQMIGLTP